MIKNTNKLIEKLKDSDPSARRKAAEGLSGGDARGIYPLIAALSDENTGVQDAAMRALITLGGEVVAYMVLPLLREGSYLRNTALIILRSLGAVSVPLIYPLLKDKDHDVRKFAVDLLSEIQTGVDSSKIIPMLEDENANVRAAAAKALGDLGYREAIPHLTRRLIDEEWVCFYALLSLGDLKAEEAIPAIASLFTSPSEAVRFSAVETVGKLGSKSALPALIAFLPRATEDEKLGVVKSIVQIGVTPDMKELAPHVIKLFETGDWEDKQIALQGISQLKSPEAITHLIEAAGTLDPSNPDNDEKLSQIKRTLLDINSEEELISLLDSPDLKFRGKTFVINILGAMKSARAAESLAVYLRDVSRDLRRAAAEALGRIGDSMPVEDLLETAKKDADSHVRKAAIEALGNIGSKEAYPELKDILGIEIYGDILEKVVEALGKIDKEAFLSDISAYSNNVRQIIARSAADLQTLYNLASDADAGVVVAAINGLGRIGSDEAINRTISFLGNANAEIRKATVIALGEARRCPAELVSALADSDPGVRYYAVKSIAASCDGAEGIEKIKAMINDEYIPVAMATIDAIREVGGREAYETLAPYEEHPNADVREKISEVLSSL
jgi:HEAT repeat protein